MGKGLYSPHAWLLLAVPLLSGYRCYIYRLFRAKGLPFQLVEFDGRSDYGPFISQDVFIPGVWYDFSLSPPLLPPPLLLLSSPSSPVHPLPSPFFSCLVYGLVLHLCWLCRHKQLPYKLGAFTGRSDYGPFIAADVDIPG